MIKIKRVYEEAADGDGFRVLVDRIWPRGLSKASASIDLWCKEVAPETSLRKWFGHDPEKWKEFKARYATELKTKRDLIKMLKSLEKEHRTVTLVYGAKDEAHNQAVVLRDVLKS